MSEQRQAITACLMRVQEELCCDIVLVLNLTNGNVLASVVNIDSTLAEQLLSLAVPYIMMTHRGMKVRDGASEPIFDRQESEAAGYCYYFGYGTPGWVVVALSRRRLMLGLARAIVHQCVQCLEALHT
ncbi:MAG TPA: hypothetical protein VD886_17275 [Herpetosiphonaceae bacterium]|nr:hypothetical protein [Herpetosiphonaceae bacterium]